MNMSAIRHYRFDVDGMTCAACAGRAEEALAAVPGVSRAEVNLATRQAQVEGIASASELAAALRTAGYPAAARVAEFDVDGMHGASCSARIEAALRDVPGVLSAEVNFANGHAHIETLGDDDTVLVEAIAGAGYKARPKTDAVPAPDRQAKEARGLLWRLIVAALLTVPVVVLEMGGQLVPSFRTYVEEDIGLRRSWMIQMALTVLVLTGPGWHFVRIGIPALLRGRPEMNSLVALGTLSAFIYSAIATLMPQILPLGTVAIYFEAAAVIVTLILLGRWLEAKAKGRTGAAIRALTDLSPKTAHVYRGGDFVDLPAADLVRGDVVRVRPFERVAVDGEVIDGASFVDESMLTGESMPVEKAPGALVTGGTMNGDGTIVVRAEAVGRNSTLARIVAMVDSAQNARLPVQDLVNAIVRIFVPVVLLIAALTIAVWLTWGPEPALTRAIVAAVSVLIIACPCAMGLAAPVSIMVGTGRGAELGVLFREGDALQALSRVSRVIFDKTGTLTEGRPTVVTREAPDEVLALAAGLEAHSTHPLAQAIVATAREAGVAVPKIGSVKTVPGLGLRSEAGGLDILVGSPKFLRDSGIAMRGLDVRAAELESLGQTVVMVSAQGLAIGLFGITDPVKPGAEEAVRALRSNGIEVTMVSGDSVAAARAVASRIGIEDVIAGVLPEGKVKAVERYQVGGPVAFVGDGINDAPALARADTGIAIGSGTSVAVEAGSVVLVSGDPRAVLRAIRLSRAVMKNIRQNLGWAFGYNILLIPVAAGVLAIFGGPMLTPALAAAAMAASSVFVVVNALRLRRAVPETPQE